MPRDNEPAAATWQCVCGRTVPARFEECHCGVTRARALQAAMADAPPPPKPLTLLGLAVRLGSLAAVVVLGTAVYLVYFQPEPPPPVPTPSLMPVPRLRPLPTASTPPEETLPPWPSAAPVYDPPPAPKTVPPEPPPPETQPAAPDGPSDMDRLRERAEFWRGRYQSVATRIAQIEKDIAQLEVESTRFIPPDHAPRGTASNKDLLDGARKRLDEARRELRDIEDGARRDGVSSGQLY